MTVAKQILVPTDFSEDSDFALATAVEHAKVFGAAIHLVYVVPKMPETLGEIISFTPQKRQQDLEKRCRPFFDEQLAKLPQDHGLEIITRVERGVPFRRLLKYAKKQAIDMIVISSKGESAVEEVLFGGTSLKTIRYAECPILLIKKPKYP